jgi:hypothetical protein
MDTLTGETEERKLEHGSGGAEKFCRGLPGPALIGMEPTGNCQSFVELASTAGHEVWIGDAAMIRECAMNICIAATSTAYVHPAKLSPDRSAIYASTSLI